ncbi:MAG: hypothetical protein CBC35_05230 [Planctomycetes bacterium TMED75]|nr:hypothetical protein [Planctomycetaceae bacterium]OUU93601.1 MAG: hypothetical protein CBC35_05230 [Planctomycetes bacterium TMED75]
MNFAHNDEKLQRLRSILSAMDRSIDKAREQRENFVTEPNIAGGTKDTEKVPGKKIMGEPRLPTSIFDRSGPMLKARPKRKHDT